MIESGAVETLVPDRLTIGTYGGFAPVCYTGSDGQAAGFDIAFLARFAQSLGLDVSTIERPFDGIWTLPGASVCDIAAAGIMQRDDRSVAPGGSWSEPYFQVQRSLLVRAAERAEFPAGATFPEKTVGKTIVVTRGSTAEIDARSRYPGCTIQYVDVVGSGQPDPQEFIATTLLASRQVDAFAEGDLCNEYLRERYGQNSVGGLAVVDRHPMPGPPETFNFVVRDASVGLLDRLNAFIGMNRRAYGRTSE